MERKREKGRERGREGGKGREKMRANLLQSLIFQGSHSFLFSVQNSAQIFEYDD